jgi:alkanesulfonate monooxygenase SsuD/methylene tetrahydromethanopterin reductase-like flavin-dependent oxidoreductase (luciferase family)
MKFGIYLPNFGSYGEARVLANLAQDAENSGWDGFFIWDHIAGWTLPMVDPWVALAAIAVTTHRIRIGTTVTPLPRRRPWKLARETVSIDHLSGGRLTLGVGIGGGASEWAHLGEQPDLKNRGVMLDEALMHFHKTDLNFSRGNCQGTTPGPISACLCLGDPLTEVVFDSRLQIRHRLKAAPA